MCVPLMMHIDINKNHVEWLFYDGYNTRHSTFLLRFNFDYSAINFSFNEIINFTSADLHGSKLYFILRNWKQNYQKSFNKDYIQLSLKQQIHPKLFTSIGKDREKTSYSNYIQKITKMFNYLHLYVFSEQRIYSPYQYKTFTKLSLTIPYSYSHSSVLYVSNEIYKQNAQFNKMLLILEFYLVKDVVKIIKKYIGVYYAKDTKKMQLMRYCQKARINSHNHRYVQLFYRYPH